MSLTAGELASGSILTQLSSSTALKEILMKPLFLISCPFDTYSGYGARSRDVVKAMISIMDDNKFGERYILSSENLFYKDVFFK